MNGVMTGGPCGCRTAGFPHGFYSFCVSFENTFEMRRKQVQIHEMKLIEILRSMDVFQTNFMWHPDGNIATRGKAIPSRFADYSSICCSRSAFFSVNLNEEVWNDHYLLEPNMIWI